MRIWGWRQGEVLRTISADASAVDFDPSGSRIATPGRAGQAEIWDVESGTRLAMLAGNSGGINDVAYAVAHGTHSGLRRAAGIGLGVVTIGCFVVAAALPFVIRPGPSSAGRPPRPR